MELKIKKSQFWKDDVAEWAELAKAAKAKVVSESMRECFELATATQPSIKDSGTYSEGFIALDTEELWRSQRVTVDGQTVAQGPGSPDGVPDRVTQRMDVALVFDAPHAPLHEYGSGSVPGRFFVRNAVQQWLQIVEAVAQRHRR